MEPAQRDLALEGAGGRVDEGALGLRGGRHREAFVTPSTRGRHPDGVVEDECGTDLEDAGAHVSSGVAQEGRLGSASPSAVQWTMSVDMMIWTLPATELVA